VRLPAARRASTACAASTGSAGKDSGVEIGADRAGGQSRSNTNRIDAGSPFAARSSSF
jgi:hypothetical protein